MKLSGIPDAVTGFAQPVYLGSDLRMSDSSTMSQDLLGTKYKLYANDIDA